MLRVAHASTAEGKLFFVEAAELIEELYSALESANEQLAGMEIMLTSAQSAAETYKRELDARAWISVKKRLPDEAEDVLVFCRNGDVTWAAIAHRIGKRWWRTGIPIEYVTHWMPMPEEDANDG